MSDETGTSAPGSGPGGHVDRLLSRSEPWWPVRPSPPAGAPNVVVILVDDLGYSDLGCFGSEIPTPHIDSLAATGVQLTDFHAQPSCSPTRASLLTGLECHQAGFGFPAQFDPGFPGYAMELPDDAVCMAEVFRANGYATAMVGKWHLARETDGHAAGDRRSWPLQRGFDRFYGFIDGFTDFHHPHQLVVDNTTLDIDDQPEGYYLTDDLTDRAIAMLRDSKAGDPAKPVFLYLAHGAVHAPLHAKPADIANHLDRYQVGWDAIRAERFARQRELGVVAPDTELPPRNHEPGSDVGPWDALSADEQRLFARYMAVYAAMVDNLDQNVGRLLAALDELGVRDDTIVMLLSDNGASREGGPQGTTDYLDGLHGGFGSDLSRDLERLDLIGSARTFPHYPRGWAMASSTPFRLYKITTHAGGHTVPFVLSWPRGLDARGIRPQYAHVNGILPTLIDLIGLRPLSERNGRPARPLAAGTFASVLVDEHAPSTHRVQHYESIGNRAYYRDGWEAVSYHTIGMPFTDDRWELYHLDEDPTERHDLAGSHPDRLAELVRAFDEAAWAAQVFPIVDDFVLFAGVRPPSDDALLAELRLRPRMPTVDRYRSAKLVQGRSFTITVDVEHRRGDQGLLVSHGSQGGGYELTVEDDALVWTHNARGAERRIAGGPVAEGSVRLTAIVAAHPGAQWTVTLLVGTRLVASGEGFAAFTGMAPLQGIDVGRSRRSPVSWTRHVHHGAFPYSGTLRSVTYRPGPLVADAAESIARERRLRSTVFD